MKVDISKCLVSKRVVGVLEQYQLFSNVVPNVKNVLEKVSKSDWFELKIWLDMQKTIAKQFGFATLFFIGQRTLYNAIWPENIDSMEKAFESINIAYNETHKNCDIGYYDYKVINSKKFEITCVTPYGDYFNIGLVKGLTDHFKKRHLWSWIEYSVKNIESLEKYDDFNKIKIYIELVDEDEFNKRLNRKEFDSWINDNQQVTDKLLQELIWTFDVVTSDLSLKSNTDPLTGLYNRHYFKQVLRDKIDYFNRYENHMSLIFADIDFFKNINDTYGHMAGDQVLKKVSEILKKNIRKSDIVTRWGGEEFAILFFNTSVEQAERIAKIIKEKIQKENYEIFDEDLTISIGVTSVLRDDTINTWFKRADDALYIAKKSGRNRVCVL